ncbi:hypothetical protein [Chryseobacterium wanjuense]
MEKKEYQKALDYYFQSLAISQKMKRKDHVRNAYEKISKAFKVLPDQEKADEYYKNFSFLNDSINTAEKKVLHIIVERLTPREKTEERNKTLLYISIAILSAIFLGILFFVSKAYIKNQKKKMSLSSRKMNSSRKKMSR